MSKYVYIAIILAASVGVVAVNRPVDTTDVKAGSAAVEPSLQGKSESFGAVDIEITPIRIEVGQNIILTASFNTHSVDLSYIWENVASLKDDLGNVYDFVEWTGGSGGHHLKGDFIFSDLQSEAKELTLVLNGIDGATKSLVWEL